MAVVVATKHHHKHKGREQRRKSAKGKAHQPDLHDWYRYHLPPLHPGDFKFDLVLLRPHDQTVKLDQYADSLVWNEDSNIMSGSVTAHRPVAADPTSLPVARGQLVRLRVAWDGQNYLLWTMRQTAPQTQLDTAAVTLTLQDDLAQLKGDVQDWIFRRTKARSRGYFCNEIAEAVADKIGLPTGELAKGTKPLNIVKRKSSAYDVIFEAYMEEHKASHRDFIIRIRDGKLEVVTLQRNPILYVLGSEIQTAMVAQKTGSKAPTTVLTGTGAIGKGKGAKKVSYTAYDRGVVGRLGYVHESKSYGTVKSYQALKDQVKRDLAAGLRLNNTITIQVAGIPFIRRGDGVEIRLPAEGYKGKTAFVYCTQASHAVQSGSYVSTFTFIARDPFRQLWGAENKALAARAQKRSKRHRHLKGRNG